MIAVGAADPIGLQRLIRGLAELRDAEISAPVWVVLNRVRDAVVPGKPEVELAAALQRFAGRSPAAFLPYDRDALDAALAHGKTLAEARGNSRLRRRMVELASALAGVPAARTLVVAAARESLGGRAVSCSPAWRGRGSARRGERPFALMGSECGKLTGR